MIHKSGKDKKPAGCWKGHAPYHQTDYAWSTDAAIALILGDLKGICRRINMKISLKIDIWKESPNHYNHHTSYDIFGEGLQNMTFIHGEIVLQNSAFGQKSFFVFFFPEEYLKNTIY